MVTSQRLFGKERGLGRLIGSVGLGILVASLGFPDSVRAQAASETEKETARAQAASELGEITVTVRKFAESIQTVPASILAVSGEQLQRANVTDLTDLTRAVPGLNVKTGEPNHLLLSIRGITTASDRPTAALIVDDIPLDTPFHDITGQYEPPVLDLERVEVLPGPQGTLYGGSSMGGAVKYVSRRPSFSEFQSDVRLALSSTEGGGIGHSESATINVPFNENLALRASASYNDVAGFIDRRAGVTAVTASVGIRPTYTSPNTVNDDDSNSYTVTQAKASLLWLPGADVEVTPHLMYQRTEGRNTSAFWPNLPAYQTGVTMAQPVEDTFSLASVDVHKPFGFGDFTSITGYVRTKDATTEDRFPANSLIFANVPNSQAPGQPSLEGSTNESFTQEFRLAHNDMDSAFGYVGGVFYRELKIDRFQNMIIPGSGLTSETLPDDYLYGDHVIQRDREAAAFSELYLRAGIFEFTVGARAYDVKTTADVHADGLFAGGVFDLKTENSASGVTPKFVISATPSPDHMVYALASKGFRLGGATGAGVSSTECAADLAALGLTEAPLQYDSDSLWNYEVGSKNSFAGGALIANATAFYIDWSQQQQFVFLPSCGSGFVGNVGEVVSKGAELQIIYGPSTWFTVTASGIYNDVRITEHVPGTPGQVGDPITNSPKWVANLAVESQFPIGVDVTGELRADYQYQDSRTQGYNRTINRSFDPFTGEPLGSLQTIPNPGYLQEPYQVVNVSAGVLFKDTSVRLSVQNLLDERTQLSWRAAGAFPNQAYVVRPRTYLLAVALHF